MAHEISEFHNVGMDLMRAFVYVLKKAESGEDIINSPQKFLEDLHLQDSPNAGMLLALVPGFAKLRDDTLRKFGEAITSAEVNEYLIVANGTSNSVIDRAEPVIHKICTMADGNPSGFIEAFKRQANYIIEFTRTDGLGDICIVPELTHPDFDTSTHSFFPTRIGAIRNNMQLWRHVCQLLIFILERPETANVMPFILASVKNVTSQSINSQKPQ
jgi:hypothetical protein